MTGRLIRFPIALTFLLAPAFAGEKKPHPANAPAPKATPAARVEAPRGAAGNQGRAPEGRAQQAPKPGQQIDKLLNMTPAERQKALSALPPARRQNIERRIGEIQKLPPAQQNRVINRLELLNSLPPQRQNQVRRSMKQFQELPEERQTLLKQELGRITRMPDEERRARMNSEEFRNRYSASEQQMLGDLIEIQPEP